MNFRMPRAHDPRRHHAVREWADGERQAGQHAAPPRLRERLVYGLITIAVLAVALAAVVRLI
jgi:hypothetical protein